MTELQPCPFCGRAEFITWHDPKTTVHPWFRIECDYCGAKGPGTDHGDHAGRWNHRVPATLSERDTVSVLRADLAALRIDRDAAVATRDLWRRRAEAAGYPTLAQRDAVLAARLAKKDQQR